MTQRIPKQYHFIFGLKRQLEPFHLVHYLCLESCLRINRPECIYFYYHFKPYGRYWDLIQDKLNLVYVELNSFVTNFEYLDPFVRKYRYAHQSDFIRLEQLLLRGGVYADIDTIFVNPIPDALFDQPSVLGREQDVVCQTTNRLRPSLCNAVILSEPNGAFVRTWLERLKSEFDGSWSNHSTFLPYELSRQFPDFIRVEPLRSFFYHGASIEGIRMLMEGCDTDYNGIYSMHLWSHLWWSRWRRDFSDFHAGRLQEDFIRNVDTTYNIAARPFLPTPRKPIFLSGMKQMFRSNGD